MMILTSDTIAKVVSIRSLDIGNSDLAGHLKLFSVEHCWCQTVELSSSGPTNEPSAKRWSPIIFYFLIWDTWILTDFLYFLLASREDHQENISGVEEDDRSLMCCVVCNYRRSGGTFRFRSLWTGKIWTIFPVIFCTTMK